MDVCGTALFTRKDAGNSYAGVTRVPQLSLVAPAYQYRASRSQFLTGRRPKASLQWCIRLLKIQKDAHLNGTSRIEWFEKAVTSFSKMMEKQLTLQTQLKVPRFLHAFIIRSNYHNRLLQIDVFHEVVYHMVR